MSARIPVIFFLDQDNQGDGAVWPFCCVAERAIGLAQQRADGNACVAGDEPAEDWIDGGLVCCLCGQSLRSAPAATTRPKCAPPAGAL